VLIAAAPNTPWTDSRGSEIGALYTANRRQTQFSTAMSGCSLSGLWMEAYSSLCLLTRVAFSSMICSAMLGTKAQSRTDIQLSSYTRLHRWLPKTPKRSCCGELSGNLYLSHSCVENMLLQAERQKEGQEPEKATGYKPIVNQNHSNGTTAPSRVENIDIVLRNKPHNHAKPSGCIHSLICTAPCTK
jgi:hypothetical protein